MNRLNKIALSILIFTPLLNGTKENENKVNIIKIDYESLDFTNSKKKRYGNRYGVEFGYIDKKNSIKAYLEKTKTKTKKIVPKDLDVNKFALKYQYNLNRKDKLTLSYGTISDNLMRETNGGDIFGVGYSRGKISFMQYLSDYPHFDVYQSDLKYTIKGKIKTTLIGKYIHLEDKNSNSFSKNAKENYFNIGVKLHTHYKRFYLGTSAYFGKRIFAVMGDSMRVQHHAMEFKETYMTGVKFNINKSISTRLKYIYQKAKEIPMDNDNVKVQNISLDFIYKF